MVNQNIVKYLREGIKRGFNIPLLKQKLLEGGFRKDDIEEAANFVQGSMKLAVKKPAMPVREISRPVESIGKETTEPVNKKIEYIGSGEKLGVFSKLGKAFAHPVELFEKTKREGVFSSLKYLWFISLVPFILGALVIFLFLGALINLLMGFLVTSGVPAMTIGVITFDFSLVESLLIILGWGVCLFVIFPIMMFVSAGIMHLFMKLFKGSGGYGGTFRSFVYSSTPSVILMVVPIVNGIAGIWTFVLNLFGLSINHEFSKLRAFLALLVGVLVVSIIVGIILVYVISLFVPAIPI